MRTCVCVAATLAVCLVGAPQVHADAEVYIVHGIPGEDLGLDPGLPVDIAVNGECAITGFEFGKVSGPVSLPEGVYDIAIGLANPDVPCGSDSVITATVPIVDGETYAITANLTADLAPTANLFALDLTATGAEPRVIVHHIAAAPMVDISLKRFGNPHVEPLVLEDVSNSDQGAVQVRVGKWDVAIAPAGQDDPVFGPIPLKLRPNMVYVVFAVGSLQSQTFTLLLEPISVFPGK